MKQCKHLCKKGNQCTNTGVLRGYCIVHHNIEYSKKKERKKYEEHIAK